MAVDQLMMMVVIIIIIIIIIIIAIKVNSKAIPVKGLGGL
jgi:hypothetical protein